MNITSILNYMSFTGMIAIPMVFLLVAKVMDLSVGAVTGFLSAILAILCKNIGLSPIVSVAIIILLGLIIGYINGLLIVQFKNKRIHTYNCNDVFIQRFDAGCFGGRNIVQLPETLIAPSSISLLGLNLNIYMFIFIAIIGWFILQKTAFGKNVYIIGNNEVIAKILSGSKQQPHNKTVCICLPESYVPYVRIL